MNLTINDQQKEVEDGISVSKLLAVEKVKMPEMVSVELNGEIQDRQTFDDTVLKDGDKVEFLYFMGGGSA
jgi:sulfur carrier protein